MPDEVIVEQTEQKTEQKTDTKPVITAGKIEKVNPSQFQKQNNLKQEVQSPATPNTSPETTNIENDKPKGDGVANSETKSDAKLPELTEEQLTAFFESKQIKWDGNLDSLKEKLEYTPPTTTPTKEELAAQEAARDKKLLDKYVAAGGKIEDFVEIKRVANADVAELSLSEVKRELKAEGFTDEEIPALIKSRYFQINPEEIEQGEDEDDDDFAKRKAQLTKQISYGAKKLANRSSYLKQQAEQIINGFARQLEEEEKDVADEQKFSTEVETYFKALPKEATIELGEIEKGFTAAPITHKVSETSIQKAEALLKNPQERNNFFFTQDGSLNLPNITKLLVSHFDFQDTAKSIYIDATTRNTEKFEATFPLNSGSIGVGGAPQKQTQKGVPVKAGAIERIRPQYQ
jgi:hypothetical protein